MTFQASAAGSWL